MSSLTKDNISQTGLVCDYVNSWMGVMLLALSFLGRGVDRTEEELLEGLSKRVPESYEEYFLKWHPENWEDAVRLSNPDRVREADSLVSEYREDLPRIIREKDFPKLVLFCKRADMLIRGDEFPPKR